MTYWKKLIEDKRGEIESAIAEATKMALKTGDRFTVTLDWNGEIDFTQDPSHGMSDLGIRSNDLIELAVIDFRTFELEGTRGGRI